MFYCIKNNMENSDIFDAFDMITNKSNFIISEIIYEMSFEELQEITKIAQKGLYRDQFGETFSIEMNDRYIILHLPNNYVSTKKYKLLLFFHGLGDHPWSVAIKETRWRKLSNEYQFIITFAAGTSCDLIYDRRCEFDIKYPENDLHYMENMIHILTADKNLYKSNIKPLFRMNEDY